MAGETHDGTFNRLEPQLRTIQTQAAQQYATLTAAGGQVQQDANQIASLNTQISQAMARRPDVAQRPARSARSGAR